MKPLILTVLLSVSTVFATVYKQPREQKVLLPELNREPQTNFFISGSRRIPQAVKEGHADGPEFEKKEKRYYRTNTEMIIFVNNFSRVNDLTGQETEDLKDCLLQQISRSNDSIDPDTAFNHAVEHCVW